MFKDLKTVEAVINTVNCVGVMGKGVALEFKKRYPKNFENYKEVCKSKELQPGKLLIVKNEFEEKPDYIINFPTKNHWRSPSKIEYIESGLKELRNKIELYKIKSVLMPALGCGNGQLDWNDVKPLIEKELSHLQEVTFLIYEPSLEKVKDSNKVLKPKITKSRGLLLLLIDRFNQVNKVNAQYATFLEVNYLAYLIQNYGHNLGLEFCFEEKGPISKKLNKFLLMFKDHYIDVEKRINGYSYIKVKKSEFKQRNKLLKDEKTKKQYEFLSSLIEGFETSEKLQSLVSVHWFMYTEKIIYKELENLQIYLKQEYSLLLEKNNINQSLERLIKIKNEQNKQLKLF